MNLFSRLRCLLVAAIVSLAWVSAGSQALGQSPPTPPVMIGGTSSSSLNYIKGYLRIATNGIYTNDLNFNTIPTPGVPATFVTTTGTGGAAVTKTRTFSVAPTSLSTTATTNYTFAVGRASTITQITAYALTPPSGTGDVTIQVFKNSTSANPVCAVYDLNALTAATGAAVPITGNSSLSATDGIVVQIVTGASLGTAANIAITVETLTQDY